MMIKIEYQYFEDCPNHKKMIKNLKEAIEGLEEKIVLREILVEDKFTAKRVGFRGSPTVLIDEEDIEGILEPIEPNLSCRFYSNGIPKADEIRKMIFQKITQEK